MANRYVSVSGNNSNLGTLEFPWRTITYAVNNANEYDYIIILPGTYIERVVIPKNNLTIASAGEVLIDGTGNTSTVEIAGKSGISLIGLQFTNKFGTVGWSNVEGVAIRDLGNVSGTGSNNITIRNCVFKDFRRKPDEVNSPAIPLLIASYANGTATNCHHIIVENCEFYSGELSTQSGFHVGHIVLAGNVEEVLIKDNYIEQDYSVYSNFCSGIECSNNYNYPADPDSVRNCVITGNTLKYIGPDTNSQSIYVQGASSVLIERNYIDWGSGLVVVCENGSYETTNTTRNILIRRNHVISRMNNLVVGAWASTYRTVRNIWIDSNTFTGNVNLVSGNSDGGAENLLISNNVILGTVTNSLSYDPFTHNTFKNVIQIDNLYYSVPEWVGSFGEYTTKEADLNGCKQKACRGAIEITWKLRKRARSL